MTNVIESQDLIRMLTAVADKLNHERDRLNQLDSALGDGDHGTGISTAFASVAQTIAPLANEPPAQVLRLTATTLMNRMGGASGALFGTLFLKGALVTQDMPTLSKQAMDAILSEGLQGVMARGKAQVGDKTMIDALKPAVDAFCQQETWLLAWQAASQAARQGAQSTQDLIAKHGRAKFIGERSVGYQDAGATSIQFIFEAFYAYWEGQS